MVNVMQDVPFDGDKLLSTFQRDHWNSTSIVQLVPTNLFDHRIY